MRCGICDEFVEKCKKFPEEKNPKEQACICFSPKGWSSNQLCHIEICRVCSKVKLGDAQFRALGNMKDAEVFRSITRANSHEINLVLCPKCDDFLEKGITPDDESINFIGCIGGDICPSGGRAIAG